MIVKSMPEEQIKDQKSTTSPISPNDIPAINDLISEPPSLLISLFQLPTLHRKLKIRTKALINANHATKLHIEMVYFA